MFLKEAYQYNSEPVPFNLFDLSFDGGRCPPYVESLYNKKDKIRGKYFDY
jgi:hypothetical protein